MPVYYTPGVYFEKIDSAKRKIPAIRTDIPGFVGIAEKGLLNKPVKLESWKQYQSVFGGFVPQSYLSYAVYGFFENGGDTCYVVRIADLDSAKKAKKAGATLFDKNNSPTIEIYALNEGQWGNKIKVALKEVIIGSTITAEPSKQPADKKYSIVKSITGFEKGSLVKAFQNKNGTTIEDHHYVKSIDLLSKKIVWDSPLNAGFDLNKPVYFSTIEFTLTLSLNNRFREIHENLSLNKDHSRYMENIINGQSNLVTVEDLGSLSPIPNNLPDPVKLEKGYLYLEGGMDGMSSIDIYDFIGDPTMEKKRGLRCYEDIDEASIICIPDIMIQPVEIELPPPAEKPDPCAPPGEEIETYTPAKPEHAPVFSADDIENVQRAMVDHCELLKDRVAILDPPFNFDVLQIYEWRQKLNSKYAALYYPWIIVNDPLRIKGNITRLIPPSGHIAGVYARTDLTKGVHKAPANEEVFGAKDTSIRIGNSEQDILNPEGINCLRVFTGKGVLIWGTRTVSRDPIWKYINIRRLIIMIEESVEEAMQWAVFEPNDVYLRNGINVAVSSFLEEIWRQGALTGKTAAEAFFVKCDEDNNPQYVIDAGQIITDIGVAPSIPGEFIIFRIGRVKDGVEIIKEGM